MQRGSPRRELPNAHTPKLSAQPDRRALQLAVYARARGIREASIAYLRTEKPHQFNGREPDRAYPNAATDSGLTHAAHPLGMTTPEVHNRATVTRAIEIGRNPRV